MPLAGNLGSGGFNPGAVTAAGYPSGVGLDRTYREDLSLFRTRLTDNLRIKQRQANLSIMAAGTKLGEVTNKSGQRFLIPTTSIPGVGAVSHNITTSSFSYPDAIASDAISSSSSNFYRQITTTGATVLGIPLPVHSVNEGAAELFINQYRGLLMVFQKDFLENCAFRPDEIYPDMITYALNADMELYTYLTCLYTGPITETAADYGSLANDNIGITNSTNYTLTRTLTSVGTSPNLITPTSTGVMAGMSNSTASRFGASPNNVPWLVGSTTSDIQYSDIDRLNRLFNSVGAPMAGRKLFVESKGYSDVSNIPNFQDSMLSGGGAATSYNTTGEVGGRVMGFDVVLNNIIQPVGASSNVIYELAVAAPKETLFYGISRDPQIIADDRLNKAEMCLTLGASCRYGVAVGRPDHVAVIATRTAA